VVSREPLIILDAAHNPQGARALAGALAGNFPGREFIGVFSVLAEKDAKGIFAHLASVLTDVVITQSSSPRAIPAEELAEIASLYFAEDQVRIIADPAAAYTWAAEVAGDLDAGAVVVSGSISLVGDILKIQQKALEADD
jgi:dihydrofolate synthase/folylpolyglutamate synthase